jgi:pyruvate/2-oxoglutarate dehydrogenase complex dihydrolipoamide acyltransferase (E2) component
MSDTIGQLIASLLAFSATAKNPAKTATNPHFRSTFPPLPEVLDYVRPALAQHGLTVSQLTEGYELVTLLMHTSGEWLSSRYPLHPTKDDPQGLGSAITYARRYALLAMLGLAGDDDDDGNAASGLGATTTTQRPPAKAPPPPTPAKAQPSAPSAPAAPAAPASSVAPTTPNGAKANGNGAKTAANGNGKKAVTPKATDFSDYIIQVGTTHKGKAVKDLPLKALVWIANDMAATNPLAQETKDACAAYLKAHPELQVPAPA